jgi:hypothetical protein
MKRSFVVSVLLTLLPLMAAAQRGSSRGSSSAAATPRPAATRGSAGTPHNNPPRKQAAIRKSPPSRSYFGGHATTIAPRAAVSNPVVSQTRGNYVTASFYHRGFWPGGLLLGIGFYPPGWYYGLGLYPGVWYYGPLGFGYQFTLGETVNLSGIKFELDMIPKEDRKAVLDGNVMVDGEAGTEGRVKDFSGGIGSRKVLHLGPGSHDITVRLKGGQEINMAVSIQESRVTHVALSFNQSKKDGQSAVAAPEVKSGSESLVPAPPPDATPAPNPPTH